MSSEDLVSGDDWKTFWSYDESYFICHSQSAADSFFFPLQVKWCLRLVWAFKERDHWPTGRKITTIRIKSCPQKSGRRVSLNACVCACLCICAHAFKRAYIHNVVCPVLLGLCPPPPESQCVIPQRRERLKSNRTSWWEYSSALLLIFLSHMTEKHYSQTSLLFDLKRHNKSLCVS